jgi:hypothetical protein
MIEELEAGEVIVREDEYDKETLNHQGILAAPSADNIDNEKM